TEEHLWVESYDHDLRDVLSLQSGIARAIAREIRIKIAPAEQARLTSGRPINHKAYDDYLLGIFPDRALEIVDGPAQIRFRPLVPVEDASYAPAHAGLADCYGVLAVVFEDPREFAPKAKAAAMNALM